MPEALSSLPLAELVSIAIGAVLFVASAIGFTFRGPLRWVKITTALLVADFLLLHCLHSGWQSGLQTAGILAGSIFVSVSFAFFQWRHPIHKVFTPATLADCPAHARGAVEGWTRDLEMLGFGIAADARTLWQIHGQDRVTFVRFLTHHSEPLWFELHALDNPKIAARMVTSDKGDGRAVMTADQQADQELFDDPATLVQRVSRANSCTEMLDAHRKLAMTTEGRLERVEDPVQAHVEIYSGWVHRLLATRQVREVEEKWIALRPGSIPGLVFKTWAAWFH